MQDKTTLLRELPDLISKLNFTDERADYKNGDHWIIYVHPRIGKEQRFDAQINIIPIFSTETIDLENLRLLVQKDNISWFPTRKFITPRRELQVLVEDLPLGNFTALGQFINQDNVKRMFEEVLAAEALAAESITEEPRAKPRAYFLKNRNLYAILEEKKERTAVLTIQTSEPQLEGTSVWFRIYDEEYEVTLKPSNRLKDVWGGSHHLKQPFKVVEDYMPSFETRTVGPKKE